MFCCFIVVIVFVVVVIVFIVCSGLSIFVSILDGMSEGFDFGLV